jgi:hypothetical protein
VLKLRGSRRLARSSRTKPSRRSPVTSRLGDPTWSTATRSTMLGMFSSRWGGRLALHRQNNRDHRRQPTRQGRLGPCGRRNAGSLVHLRQMAHQHQSTYRSSPLSRAARLCNSAARREGTKLNPPSLHVYPIQHRSQGRRKTEIDITALQGTTQQFGITRRS